MLMKTILLKVIIIIPLLSKGQDEINERYRFITNDSIRYDVLSVAPTLKATNKIRVTKYFVTVNISQNERRKYKKLNYKQWLLLLENNKTDWATNLILYDLYEKNANSFFFDIKSRKQWVVSQKEKDIKYWGKYLKKVKT